MEPRIETLAERKLAGKRMKMSFSDDKTRELWQMFMPRRKEIKNNINSDLYSVEIYAQLFFNDFNPNAEYEKWAAVEVKNFDAVPDEMETVIIPAGLYAVFLYKGLSSEVAKTYQYIFGTWLPDSDFLLDNRPHFALMGRKYKNEDRDSEEELWIPIKPKNNGNK